MGSKRSGRRALAVLALLAAVTGLAIPSAASAAAPAKPVYSVGYQNLGHGVKNGEQPVPEKIAALAGSAVIQVSSNDQGLVLALTSGGKVFSWGENTKGQLGDGTTTDDYTPHQIALPTGVGRVTRVAAGADAGVALTSSGRVLTWGDSEQLGDGSTADRLVPAAITLPGHRSAVSISAGGTSVIVVTSDGSVYGWGYNAEGQLGTGRIGPGEYSTPQKAVLPAGFKAYTAAIAGNLFVAGTQHGSWKVLAWGGNSDGELGDGRMDTYSHLRPVVVRFPAGTARITSLYVGFQTSGALSSTGVAYRWGNDDFGNNGDGTVGDNAAIPQTPALPTGTVVTGMSVGDYTTVVATADGVVYGWGYNGYQAFGAGPDVVPSPVQIDLPTDTAAAVDSDTYATFAVLGNG